MWRSSALGLLQGARTGCLELHGESGVTRALRSLARDINLLSADQLRAALRGVVAAVGPSTHFHSEHLRLVFELPPSAAPPRQSRARV